MPIGSAVFFPKSRAGAPLLAMLAWLFLLPPAVPAAAQTPIRLVVGGESISAVLEDNPTTRDLLTLLPLTLTMRDYQGTEKIGDPPRRLSTEDAPDGCLPAAGDLTLYAPWGNLAIFYQDFSWSRGLIPLGRITSGLEKLAAMRGDFTMTMERAE